MLDHAMTATIRTLASADFDAVSALYSQLKPSHLDRPVDLSSTRFDAFVRNLGVTILGAFDGDRLVAACILHVMPSLTNARPSYALIENLVILPGEHRKGHRRRLIQAAGAAAVEADCERIMLMSGRSRQRALLRELRLKVIRQPNLYTHGSLTFRPR